MASGDRVLWSSMGHTGRIADRDDDRRDEAPGNSRFMTGAEVCQALIPVVARGRTTGGLFEQRATREVLQVLSEDARGGTRYDADRITARQTVPGRCLIESDQFRGSWFAVTLESMPDGSGERATRAVRRTGSD